MLEGTVTLEQVEPPPPPEKQDVVHLDKEDLSAIIRCLLDLSYDSTVDTYKCPSRIIELGEQLGVT